MSYLMRSREKLGRLYSTSRKERLLVPNGNLYPHYQPPNLKSQITPNTKIKITILEVINCLV